jgi:hypothetical protein
MSGYDKKKGEDGRLKGSPLGILSLISTPNYVRREQTS